MYSISNIKQKKTTSPSLIPQQLQGLQCQELKHFFPLLYTLIEMLKKNIWKDFIITGCLVNKSKVKDLMRRFVFYILNIMRYLILSFEGVKTGRPSEYIKLFIS